MPAGEGAGCVLEVAGGGLQYRVHLASRSGQGDRGFGLPGYAIFSTFSVLFWLESLNF